MIAAILLLVAIALVVWAICESLDDNADDFDQHADEAMALAADRLLAKADFVMWQAEMEQA